MDIYDASYKFLHFLKQKNDKLHIIFNFGYVRIYYKTKNNKTKSLYYISRENGDIINDLKKKIKLGNVYDNNYLHL